MIFNHTYINNNVCVSVCVRARNPKIFRAMFSENIKIKLMIINVIKLFMPNIDVMFKIGYHKYSLFLNLYSLLLSIICRDWC